MTQATAAPAGDVEPLPQFIDRARSWLAANMPRLGSAAEPLHRDDVNTWQRARQLQRSLYEGGFAGICFPREYGGLGLGFEYQKAFNEAAFGYELPLILNVPNFAICCATLLDAGSQAMKTRHIAAALRGEEVLVQLLSEPSGGSDLAGVITRADRVGDKWILNGAKTWSSGAFAADHGLCLARTNWDVPKHEGLTMFLVPVDHPNITLARIKQLNGSTEFCEEFFDDVELTDADVVGAVNDGWAVASRQLYHERRAVGKGSEFASGIGADSAEAAVIDLVGLVRRTGQSHDTRIRERAGRAFAHRLAREQLVDHVYHGVADGSMPAASGSLIRLFLGVTENLVLDTALAIAGTSAVVGSRAGVTEIGQRYLSRQAVCLGGGTIEIARNIIGERVLNFPREYAADRGVPFNEVRRNRV
jgi:alkylation response protein AidB-like acyl-CoA dehydrogenase